MMKVSPSKSDSQPKEGVMLPLGHDWVFASSGGD